MGFLDQRFGFRLCAARDCLYVGWSAACYCSGMFHIRGYEFARRSSDCAELWVMREPEQLVPRLVLRVPSNFCIKYV